MFDKCIIGILLALTVTLHGCASVQLPLLEPAGPVALHERNIMLAVFGLMLLIVVPIFVMTFWFIWRYRATNRQAAYTPDWAESRSLSLLFWILPAIIVVILGVIAWNSSHKLSPYRPIDTAVKPLTIEVVALDWKWLFIYPEQRIATVNQVVLPVGRPVDFKITSDTVMNSFFIPRLGGQVYAMAGMETRLYLQADKAGKYFGENTQYSGRGFPFQFFQVKAVSKTEFASWVKTVQSRHRPLNSVTYAKLALPSVKNPVVDYSPVQNDLFENVMHSYTYNGSGMPASKYDNRK